MTHLDLFLQKGPLSGNVVPGLEELRRIVLLDGIPSNNDGMVRPHVSSTSYLTQTDDKYRTVRATYLHLAYPAERAAAENERLPRSRGPRSVSGLLENPRRHVSHSNHRPALPEARVGK